jgi:hypothetical protein
LRKVDAGLRIGLSSLADEGLKVLNRAAEDAVKEALLYLWMRSNVVADARGILMGAKVQQHTKQYFSTALYGKFNPVIKNSFTKVGADKVWTNIITKYNSIPLVRKVNQI